MCSRLGTTVNYIMCSVGRSFTLCIAVLIPVIRADITVFTPRQSGLNTDTKYTLLSAYGYSATGQSSLEFEVKACQDASVVLLTTDDENAAGKFYHVKLGGWHNNAVEIGLSNYAHEKTLVNIYHVLDCNMFKRFKVNWGSRLTSVSSYTDSGLKWTVQASWQDPDPIQVNFIGVSTSVYSDGEWRIKQAETTTPELPTTTTALETTRQPEVTTTTTALETTRQPEVTTRTTDVETTTQEVMTTTDKETHTTAALDASSIPMNATCSCVCVQRTTTPSSCASDNVTCRMEAIRKELTVDKQTLSSTIRKKTSAGDDRPSAQAIGMVGVVCLVVYALVVIVPDFLNLWRYMWSMQWKPNIP